MAEKTKVIVRICDSDYPITGYEPEEYIHRIAIYVDKKIHEVKKTNPYLNTSDASILTSLNVADDFFKTREHAIMQKKQIDAYEYEIGRLEDEIQAKEETIKELKAQLDKTRYDLVKKGAELDQTRDTLNMLKK